MEEDSGYNSNEREVISKVRECLRDHVRSLEHDEVSFPSNTVVPGIHTILHRYQTPRNRYEPIWHKAVWDVNKDFEDIGVQGDLGIANAAVYVYRF